MSRFISSAYCTSGEVSSSSRILSPSGSVSELLDDRPLGSSGSVRRATAPPLEAKARADKIGRTRATTHNARAIGATHLGLNGIGSSCTGGTVVYGEAT